LELPGSGAVWHEDGVLRAAAAAIFHHSRALSRKEASLMKMRTIIWTIASCCIALSIVLFSDCLLADTGNGDIALEDASISLEGMRQYNAKIEYATDMLSLYLSRYGTLSSYHRVMNLAGNSKADTIVRIASFRACFTESHGETRRAVVARILDWTAAMDEEYRANGLGCLEDNDHVLFMLTWAMNDADTIDALVEIVSADEQGKDFLAWMMTSDFAVAMGPVPAHELLSRADLPRQVKEELAIGRIRSMTRRRSPEALIPFLPDDAEAQLMEIVHATDADYHSVNKFALHTLAHIGSQAVRDYLIENRESFRIVSFTRYTSKGPEGVRATIPVMIDYWIAMVDLQESHETLLTYITSVDLSQMSVMLRPWAVRRAVELQIDTEQILSAIDLHRKQLEKDKKCANERKLFSLRYAELELRTTVFRAGLMAENEWPSPIDASQFYITP
jgi:hypothetical protein